MAQTVISKARELICEVGKEEAIKIFQKRIDDNCPPKTFQDACNLSANETAIEFIKGEI